MNLTELLATPVIHLPTAHRMGVVCAFCTNPRARRITHVVVVDDDNYCRELYYRFADVRWGGEVALVAAEPVAEMSVPCRVPFRDVIVDTDGKGYAYLKEVVTDPKGRIVHIVNTLDEVIDSERLVRMGDVVLLRGKARIPAVRKQQPAPDAQNAEACDKQSSNTAYEYAGEEDDAVAWQDGNETRGDGSLTRIAGDYTFLIGRTLKNDLTYEGEVVAAKGEVIADDTVSRARDKGLLLSLTALSR